MNCKYYIEDASFLCEKVSQDEDATRCFGNERKSPDVLHNIDIR